MKITKQMKAKLLRDLQRGELKVSDYPEFVGEHEKEIGEWLDSLTEEEQKALSEIGQRTKHLLNKNL